MEGGLKFFWALDTFTVSFATEPFLHNYPLANPNLRIRFREVIFSYVLSI